MMRLKKMISVILTGCILLSTAACGSSTPAPSAGADASARSVAVREEDKITEPIEMNIATTWNKVYWPPNESVEYMKERIEQLSGGKIKVILHEGTLGGERELIESTQLNSIQATPVTTGPLGGFVPLAELFMVPFIFKDWNHAYAAADGAFGQRINELCLEQDIRILGWWSCGTRTIEGKGKPVVKPDDLKGMKIRIMESDFLSELYSAYGAIPTPMAYSEVFTALQQGAIDGEQTVLSTVQGGYADIVDWAAKLDEVYQLVPFMVSEKWWRTLPQEAKNIIMQAQTEAEAMERKYMAITFDSYEQLWIEAGITPHEVDRDAFEAKAKELYPKFKEMLNDDEGWFDWVVALGETFPYTYPKTETKMVF